MPAVVEVALEPLEELALGARDGKVAVLAVLPELGERQGVDAAREPGPELLVELRRARFDAGREVPQGGLELSLQYPGDAP